jgi:glutathione transport system ATP-binding protein|tara:strand:- start:1257 stop:2156 length:900 start_codon:yes stop_codon:yes gene_type:complete
MRENQVISVEGLRVCFRLDRGIVVDAVKGVSFHIDKGETVALVGESGSGKSVTAMSLMRLIENAGGEIVAGKIALRGRSNDVVDIHSQTSAAMQDIRGSDVSMIFQEPMTSLNPVLPIGFQISEAIMRHQGKTKGEAMDIALETLRLVRVPEPESRLSQYPHNLSGGMRQRVMIAMALCCRPSLMIADEPTTALDVTIQAQILDLIKLLQKEIGMSVLFITHDMAVVAEIADRICVMLQGEIVEQGGVYDIFENPTHAYTKSLLAAVPRLGSMADKELPEKFPIDKMKDTFEVAEVRSS